MPSSRRPRTAARRAGWAVFVLTIVLGVVGMHGLSMSCLGGSDHDVVMAMSATPVSSLDTMSHVAPNSGPTFRHDAPAGGVALMCIAILAAGLLLAACFAVALRGGWLVRQPILHIQTLSRTRRFRAPPDLVKLSILRC